MTDLDEIRRHLREELVPSERNAHLFICPLCGSGTGPHGTAAFSIDPKSDGMRGRCFACGWHGDIFDLLAARDGVSLREATVKAIRRYGSAPAPIKTAGKHVLPPAPCGNYDFSAEIASWHTCLLQDNNPGARYLQGRGITRESMERFFIGYDARRQCVILPYNRRFSYYGIRFIARDNAAKHGCLQGIPVPLFNQGALYAGPPCFIVESPICAISITQAGGTAAAISGTGGLDRLLRAVQHRKPAGPLLLALDCDTPGRTAQKTLAESLEALNVVAFDASDVCGAYKDPNERLQHDPEGFSQSVDMWMQTAHVRFTNASYSV